MKFKLFLSVLAGFIIGAAGMWFVVEQTTVKVFENQYLIGVMDQANVALHIREGKQLALLKNIEAALPSYALAVDSEFKGHESSTDTLWMIKAYYQRSNLEIPSEIRGIMDSLPPEPPTSCQIRLRALDSAASTDPPNSEGR